MFLSFNVLQPSVFSALYPHSVVNAAGGALRGAGKTQAFDVSLPRIPFNLEIKTLVLDGQPPFLSSADRQPSPILRS